MLPVRNTLATTFVAQSYSLASLFTAFYQPSRAFCRPAILLASLDRHLRPGASIPGYDAVVSKKAAVLFIRPRLTAHARVSEGPGVSPNGYSDFYSAAIRA